MKAAKAVPVRVDAVLCPYALGV